MTKRKAQSHEKIREEARRALEKCGITNVPVDVEAVARTLGAVVRYSPFDGELAGMLVRSDAPPVIGVNSIHPRNRQRFTIAHECGHFLLHKAEVHIDRRLHVHRRDELSSMAIDPDEIEANRFAAELLMPYDFIIADLQSRQIDIEDDEQICELAQKYGVSEQSMTIRLINIGPLKL